MPFRENEGGDDLRYRPPPQPGDPPGESPARKPAAQVLADLFDFRAPEERVAAPAPAPAPAAPAAEADPPPQRQRRRKAPQVDLDEPELQYFRDASDWRDRMIAETFVWGLGWALWGVNALFTVQGLGTLSWIPFLGPVIANPVIAFIIHVGISKGEQNLWRGGFDPWAIGFGILFLLVDAGTTINGIIASFVQAGSTQILGTLPKSILEWWPLIAAIGGKPVPEWTAAAVTLIVVGGAIALIPERVIKRFRQRMMAVWRARPRPAAA